MCNSDRRHFLQMSVAAAGGLACVGVAGVALAAEPEKGPEKGKAYVCPPCGCAADGKEFPAPGACPECGMPLVEKAPAPAPKLSWFSRPAKSGALARQDAGRRAAAASAIILT
jgi:hypothetical protein